MGERINTPTIYKTEAFNNQASCRRGRSLECPNQSLVCYKLAEQLIPDSGFDSTNHLQRAPKEQQEKPSSTMTEFYDKVQELSAILYENCSMTPSFAEEIVDNTDDEDTMSDEFYVKMHVVMESLEQLFDHNENEFEYPLYDNVRKYGLETSLEDQSVSTFTPMQTYLAPFDARVLCPNMSSELSHIEYCFPDLPGTVEVRVFPEYDRVVHPNIVEKAYCTMLVTARGEEIPEDLIIRQPSAHEEWVRIASKKLEALYTPIEECYTRILENENTELCEKMTRLISLEPDNIIGILKEQYGDRVDGLLDNDYVDRVVTVCINTMKRVLDTAPLQPESLRTYLFAPDFDISVRGLIESKSTNHFFYELEFAQKVAFLKPIIAVKLLHHHPMGRYADFLNSNILLKDSEVSVVFDSSNSSEYTSMSVPELATQLSELTEDFCGLILKEHQYILRALLTSPQANTYVQTEFEPPDDDKTRDMLIRPVCCCYACNLCSICDTYDYTSKIFPVFKVHPLRRDQHSSKNMGPASINHMGKVFQVNPYEFVEKVVDQELLCDFNKMFPYFQKISKQAHEELGIDLVIGSEIKLEEKRRRLETIDLTIQKTVPAVQELLDSILLYCMMMPSFLQFPAMYGQMNSEYPAIVLSNTFRQNRVYDPRIEALLALVKNPANVNFDVQDEDMEQCGNQEEICYRTIALTENLNVKRYMCKHYGCPFVEPGEKDPTQYSNLEVANLLYGEEELRQQIGFGGTTFHSHNATSDIRTLEGLQVSVRHLPSLPIVKKYRGHAQITGEMRMRRPFAALKSRFASKRLDIPELGFITELYQVMEGSSGVTESSAESD